MKVHMDAVKSHIPGPGPPYYGVHVGAVIVAETSCFMDNAGDFQNVGVENAKGIGVGEHETRRVFSHRFPQTLQVHAAFVVGRHMHHFIACHGGGSGIGAVGGVGDDDFCPLCIAPGQVVSADEAKARVFPPGHRLQAAGSFHPCP